MRISRNKHRAPRRASDLGIIKHRLLNNNAFHVQLDERYKIAAGQLETVTCSVCIFEIRNLRTKIQRAKNKQDALQNTGQKDLFHQVSKIIYQL